MFDLVHENKRVVQIILLLLILPLALFTVNSYRQSGGDDVLATVDGQKITQRDFAEAMRQQQQQMMQLTQGRIDPAVFETPEVKHAILDRLINDKLLSIKARSAGMMMSDEQLIEQISAVRAFQTDGKFDLKKYEAALRGQNMSPEFFQSKVQEDLATQQMVGLFMQNGYASTAVADNLVRLKDQQRVVSVAQIAPDAFLNQVKIDDAGVKKYYDANHAKFATPARARVEYVLFSADALLQQVTVSAGDVKKYYDEHKDEFTVPEQRHAAHILIGLPMQASEADKKAAQEKAESVLKEVKQAPAKFAELAKKNSADPVSAARGGDLGFFGREQMVKPFADAAFALKPGEISGLVQSDYGFHIIKLLEVKATSIKPLEEVAASISQKIKLQRAGDRFAELQQDFSNALFEKGDSLKPAAELVKAPLQQSDWLVKGRRGPAPWTDKALQAVFSDEVLTQKRNSAAIEVAPDTLLAVRLVEYKPAGTAPLAEVSEFIKKQLALQQAAELAAKQGQSLLTQLQHGEKPSVKWGAAQNVSWRTVLEQRGAGDSELVRRVLQADVGKLPAYVGFENPQGGYALARIDAVQEGGPVDDAKRAGEMREMLEATGYELLKAYLADVKSRASISVKPLAPAGKG